MTGYWKGKKRSEETKIKISQAQKGKKGNPVSIKAMAEANRKKGKSRQCFNYRQWRAKVLERDGRKCVKCSRQHEKMHCHHIEPWKDDENLRFSVENGETLCASCHIKIGKKNKEIDGTETQFKKGHLPENPFKKGMIPWNKGKTGQQDAWNKGKKGVMPTPWNKGIPVSEEIKKKISESNKGRKAWNKGVPTTEEAKQKNRESHLGKRKSPNTEFKKGSIPWNKGKKLKANHDSIQ